MSTRISLPFLMMALFAFTLQISFGQNTVQSVYQEGVKLYKEQKYMEALEKFQKILEVKPGYVYARSYVTKCQAAIAKGAGPKNDLEGQLAKVVIPQISFEDAPIGDVLQYLTSRAEELTGGKIVPNIIYKGTPEQRQNTLISLTLRNVPLTEAIRYVGQLSRTHFRYEEHAIVADPNYKAPALPTPAGAETEKPGTVFGETPKSVFD